MFSKPAALHPENRARSGSLGYQFLTLLKAVFKPGRSRHLDKKRGEANHYIYSKNTMRKYTEEAFDFAQFVKEHYQECRHPDDLTPDICAAFVDSLVRRRLDGGTIGRHQAMIRKIDAALQHMGRRHADAPPLLPTIAQGGKPGFRSNRSTEAYADEQLVDILREIKRCGSKLYGPVATQVIRLIYATGLRIQESVYLRADNIDLVSRRVVLDGNRNRTKGGRPRVTEPFDEAASEFMAELKQQGERCGTGHIFENSASLPNHVRAEIRRACRSLGIPCLGSHGFRKLNAQNLFQALRQSGLLDSAARLVTSKHLGHNRIRDTKESYVPPQDK